MTTRKRIMPAKPVNANSKAWLMLTNQLLFSARKYDVSPQSRAFRIAMYLTRLTFPNVNETELYEFACKVSSTIILLELDDRYVVRSANGLPSVDLEQIDFDAQFESAIEESSPEPTKKDV